MQVAEKNKQPPVGARFLAGAVLGGLMWITSPNALGTPGAMPAPLYSGAASGASAASAANAEFEAEALEVPLSPQQPALNLAQRTGMLPTGAFAMRQIYAKEVNRRLTVPYVDQQAYGHHLQQTLEESGYGDLANEFVLLVDRSPNVQAIFLYFRAKAADSWSMIGASPVSTGRPGAYDHFLTPLGVFQHVPDNMDFRAEGTLNEFNIRGYGARQMRVYDLGWAEAERGWGKGGRSPMRFQMHATAPERLEPLLGMWHSKGCVRIPSTLNTFFDHHGIFDAQYEARVAEGESLWVLDASRRTTPWAGHYLVVVDTGGTRRPAWSPTPAKAVRENIPSGGYTVE